jgi:multidrug transporter EmrE-like cation transporter
MAFSYHTQGGAENRRFLYNLRPSMQAAVRARIPSPPRQEETAMKYWIALALALVLNATANLMMKHGAVGFRAALDANQDRDLGTWIRILTHNWVLVLALFFFAANVLIYAYALQAIQISIAYPIMVTVGFAIIAVVAWLTLNERLTPMQWAGIGLILIGVCLVAREAKAATGT